MHTESKSLAPQLAALFAALLLVSACGQKGPLFLPGDPSAIRSTPLPEQLPQPAQDEDEDDDDDEVPLALKN